MTRYQTKPVFHTGQTSFARSLPPRVASSAHSFGKQRRAYDDPISIAKDNPYFIPPPLTNLTNFNLPMSVVLPHENTDAEQSGKLVFHSVGDTGGIHGDDVQKQISDAMEAQVSSATAPGDKPAFLFHLGDVIYFNGLSTDYSAQFYEPYKYYQSAIFAVPGNHDGDVRTRKTDPVDNEPSLYGFMANFCDTQPHDIYAYRPTMTQPYVYWTLEAPFIDIVGLYSNVEGSLDARATNEQQRWFEDQLANAPKDKWLVIAVHHAPFSLDIDHGGYMDIVSAIDRAISATGRVPDAVFSGHVHNYQRFSRMIGAQNVPYIVAGAGGYANTFKLLHKLQKDPAGNAIKAPLKTKHQGKDLHVTLESYNDSNPGFLRITVTPKNMTIDYFVVPFDGQPGADPFDSITVPWTAKA